MNISPRYYLILLWASVSIPAWLNTHIHVPPNIRYSGWTWDTKVEDLFPFSSRPCDRCKWSITSTNELWDEVEKHWCCRLHFLIQQIRTHLYADRHRENTATNRSYFGKTLDIKKKNISQIAWIVFILLNSCRQRSKHVWSPPHKIPSVTSIHNCITPL